MLFRSACKKILVLINVSGDDIVDIWLAKRTNDVDSLHMMIEKKVGVLIYNKYGYACERSIKQLPSGLTQQTYLSINPRMQLASSLSVANYKMIYIWNETSESSHHLLRKAKNLEHLLRKMYSLKYYNEFRHIKIIEKLKIRNRGTSLARSCN